MEKDPYKEYIITKEPSKKDKEYAWNTAIGLQKVDGLEPSTYLTNIASDNINGKITMNEARELINSYYEEKKDSDERIEEADKVSLRITELLSDNAFTFSFNEYLEIHRYLFFGIYKHAGKIRDYNITKKEWVLDGDTVMYGSSSSIKDSLDYDINQEKNYDYSKLNTDEKISHIARFISNLWQIHAFGEGNTRTTAVFLIKYLRQLGYNVNNDLFKDNSWYFRNALVRANYNNFEKNIYETTKYLELFLRNLLLSENNELKNRYLNIAFDEKNEKKVDIEAKKVDIDLSNYNFTVKTKDNIRELYFKYSNSIFGRGNVIDVLGLSNAGASKFINLLLENRIIVPVTGYGKGKYKFSLSLSI